MLTSPPFGEEMGHVEAIWGSVHGPAGVIPRWVCRRVGAVGLYAGLGAAAAAFGGAAESLACRSRHGACGVDGRGDRGFRGRAADGRLHGPPVIEGVCAAAGLPATPRCGGAARGGGGVDAGGGVARALPRLSAEPAGPGPRARTCISCPCAP